MKINYWDNYLSTNRTQEEFRIEGERDTGGNPEREAFYKSQVRPLWEEFAGRETGLWVQNGRPMSQ